VTAEVAAREAPSSSGLELLKTLWELRSDPLMPFVRGVERYGDIGQARVPGLRLIRVHRAEHVEHVLVRNQDNYPKGPEIDLLRPVLGRGLVTSRGEPWRRQRRLIQPMFAKRHLEPFATHMTAAGARLLDEWESTYRDGDRLDVAQAMMALALDVAGRALFGADLTGETTMTVRAAVTEALTELAQAGRSPLINAAAALPGMTIDRALWLRPRHRLHLRARIAELDGIVAQMIESHRNGSRGRDDLLTLLMSEQMDDRQLRDEVVTFLGAGHETTANALAWMWWLLDAHAWARDWLHDEVDELLEGRPPAFADADRLTWTRAVVQETLRLYPPVWNVLRRAQRDDVIGGVRIPADSVVMVLIYMTHRDPEVWPDPERFDPTRFLPEQAQGRPRHAFIPFGAGRRVCVGASFALTEATLLAAMIAQRFVLEREPRERGVPEAQLTLRPRGGLPMRLHRRGSSRRALPEVSQLLPLR
jgi:cytochrome P450